MGNEPGGVTKVCVRCGVDVSSSPRVKDKQGRYLCKPCMEKGGAGRGAAGTPSAAKTPVGAKAAPAAPGTDDVMASLIASSPMTSATPCPGCGRPFPESHTVCMSCGYNRQSGKTVRTAVVRATPDKSDSAKPARELSFHIEGDIVLLVGSALIIGGLGIASMLNHTYFGPFYLVLASYGLVTLLWTMISAFVEGDRGWGWAILIGFIIPLLHLATPVYGLFFCDKRSVKYMWICFIGGIVMFIAGIVTTPWNEIDVENNGSVLESESQ